MQFLSSSTHMTRFRNCFFTLLCIIAFYSCGTQSNANTTGNEIQFEKLIYHSSRCDGTCPQVDLQIDSNRIIIVNRVFFDSKGEIDSSRSGNFKGVLEPAGYDQFMKELQSADFKNLKFPDIQCCDGVIKTIIVYSGGDRTYLKSMTPPPEASAFISFLHQIGTVMKLTTTTEVLNMEE
ncbi:MAG: hypothetical protein H7Y01_10810 [Ferruginibacter sp.]|nr:hypothetical protein [Chitinophagaceae bacterium]